MSGEAERVVFDCVVYTQAVINPDGPGGRCLELARDGAITLCISDYVEREIRELPDKLAPRLKITPEKVVEFIRDLVSFARRVSNVPEVYVLDRDPDDSHYINLAIAADAKLITTRDHDLLDLMDAARPEGQAFLKQFPGLRILTPVGLLDLIRRR
jgi:putative PIN family toxin of toxin-antitoxin system